MPGDTVTVYNTCIGLLGVGVIIDYLSLHTSGYYMYMII